MVMTARRRRGLGSSAPGLFFVPRKEVTQLVTWMLVTVGYAAPAVVGAFGLRAAGHAATRLGRAAGLSR